MMQPNKSAPGYKASTIDDPILVGVLNELGRSINLITTYGKNHPAAKSAIGNTFNALQAHFMRKNKLLLGSSSGYLTVDEKVVSTIGTLQKTLERRLARLQITGLRIVRGITKEELTQLTILLSCNEAESFNSGIKSRTLNHVETDTIRLEAVREGQVVAEEYDLISMASSGVLEIADEDNSDAQSAADETNLHVEQIVAFLKGDIDAEAAGVGEELEKLASDPARLARMIMESVSIRQSVSELSGESLNDIILGCLRKTYDGLRKQSAFKTTEGKAELRKALLLLEESLLERMRSLTGEENPELDRQIVQAVREMDNQLRFEIAAAEYMEHREAIQKNRNQIKAFIQSHGPDEAESLLDGSGFPGNEWHRIVVESRRNEAGGQDTALASGLNTLATVFEKLEQLMKSNAVDGSKVKDLLGQASDNLDDTLDTTKEKLAALSLHLKDGAAATIGGQGRKMSRDELLSALSEVAQELMQPLTAINASLEMMLGGYVGNMTDEQSELLRLASNSGEHLKFLMNMLIDIVGCPTNKGVDNRFHTTSEQVMLMQDAEGQEHLQLNYGN